MIEPQRLTREEWRGIGIATLTAALGAMVGGVVAWGFEEAKRIVAMRRDQAAKHAPPETSSSPPA